MEVREFTPAMLPLEPFLALEDRTARERTVSFAAGIIANAILLVVLALGRPTESSTPLQHSSTRIMLIAPTLAATPLPPLSIQKVNVEKSKARRANLELSKSIKTPIPAPVMTEPPTLRASTFTPLPSSIPVPQAALAPPPPKPILGSFSEAAVRVNSKRIEQPTKIVTGEFSNAAVAKPGTVSIRTAEVGAFSSTSATSPNRAGRLAIMAQDSGFSIVTAYNSSGPRMEQVSDSGFGSAERSVVQKKATGAGVTSGSFDASLVAASSSRKSVVNAAVPDTKAVEILGKTRPLYTEEARRLRIEGEVSMRILFGADGKLRVQSIVRGLGHGLDENAALAAAQIQFRPATQNGQSVDQTAVIRVRFQLAE